jgi:hypothetical protein
MTSLLRIGWPAVLMALLIFGFASGAVLRVIVLAFERDDLRRRELLGELYHVPRVERPFWVAESWSWRSWKALEAACERPPGIGVRAGTWT